MKNTIRQFELMPVSAIRAGLTRERGIYFYTSSTGPFCLILDEIKKLSPRYIPNTFIHTMKVIFLHIVDRKIFNAYGIKSIYEFTGFLMSKEGQQSIP